MNYQLYVLGAYVLTFVLILWMLKTSYGKYRRAKKKFEALNKKEA